MFALLFCSAIFKYTLNWNHLSKLFLLTSRLLKNVIQNYQWTWIAYAHIFQPRWAESQPLDGSISLWMETLDSAAVCIKEWTLPALRVHGHGFQKYVSVWGHEVQENMQSLPLIPSKISITMVVAQKMLSWLFICGSIGINCMSSWKRVDLLSQ